MRARLVQLSALAVLLLVATSGTPDLGILVGVVAVAAVAVAIGFVIPMFVWRVRGHPTTHGAFLQPAPSHPNTAGRPQPRAPGGVVPAA